MLATTTTNLSMQNIYIRNTFRLIAARQMTRKVINLLLLCTMPRGGPSVSLNSIKRGLLLYLCTTAALHSASAVD